jgi:hypothetical protein
MPKKPIVMLRSGQAEGINPQPPRDTPSGMRQGKYCSTYPTVVQPDRQVSNDAKFRR